MLFNSHPVAEVVVNEEWRSIDGYTNYQVSNSGRVRNSKTGIIVSQNLRGKYYRVEVWKDKHSVSYIY